MIYDATGILLAGGNSLRFGSNKALSLWKGKTLIESVADILGSLFPATLIMVKEPRSFEFLTHPRIQTVQDLCADVHSLGGMYSGLSQAGTDYIFVCACDMPCLQPRLIEALWEAHDGYDAVIPIFRGVMQPLCGIYSQQCLKPMQEMIQKKQLKIKDLFTLAHTRFFQEEEVAVYDPKGLSFMDIDTQTDYDQVAVIVKHL